MALNYTETLDYLFNRLPMFQRIGPAAYKNTLENTRKLDDFYGNPHRNFRSIHIAGTNGKGSVSHMMAAVLQSAGYKTGLYTSPHLKDFRERIRINGKMISENDVVEWIENYLLQNETWKIDPSFFELTVAMAFDLFSKYKIDIAVVEVGLGGRLDSTNIISPEVSIITNIGLDHTALLGDSLEKIAAEKAGIIKSGIPAVIGATQPETEPVFKEKATAQKAPLYFADQEYKISYSLQNLERKQVVSVEKKGKKYLPGLILDLTGIYQLKNLPPVLKCIELLQNSGWNISDKSIYNGLSETISLTGLQGRWQIIGNNPLVVCDTGHNPDGIKEVVKQIEQTPHNNLHVVFGMVNDKDAGSVLKLLPKDAQYYFTKADIPRALDEKALKSQAQQLGLKGNSFPVVTEALNAAKVKAGKNDLIFIGGSTFIVAEIL